MFTYCALFNLYVGSPHFFMWSLVHSLPPPFLLSCFVCSSQMQLVIYGKQDLDQLESWATNKFSSILNRGTLPPYPPNPAYPGGYSPRLIVYKPLTPTPQLSIVWQTPSRQDLYRWVKGREGRSAA